MAVNRTPYQWTIVFRELLQNSDDASATAVEIHFETKGYVDRKNGKMQAAEDGVVIPGEDSLPDLKAAVVRTYSFAYRYQRLTSYQVHQWTFKNNGIVFRDEDWSRLKKIG